MKNFVSEIFSTGECSDKYFRSVKKKIVKVNLSSHVLNSVVKKDRGRVSKVRHVPDSYAGAHGTGAACRPATIRTCSQVGKIHFQP